MNSALPARREYLSSFGRNRGRSLSPYQQGLVENLLPQLAINPSLFAGVISPHDAGTVIPPPLRGRVGGGAANVSESSPPPSPHNDSANRLRLPRKGGGDRKPVASFGATALEIGFGAGEHLAAQARHHPETLYLGSEPYINGVAKLLAVIEREKLTNIRIDTRDVRELISELPGAALNEIFILFPDPWPKARHHKRRLINAQTLAILARVHRPGGRLLIATDHLDYTDWICEYLLASDVYHWQKTRDPYQPPPDWTETKYQRKTSAEGRRPRFFECERRRV